MSTHTTTVGPFDSTRVVKCYQCGKCTAGCPVAERMDYPPNQLMLLVQRGQVEKAARSRALWECVSCLTCTTRCPQTVEVAGVIDVLREYAVDHGIVSAERHRVLAFQKAFLDNLRRNGRLNEVELIAEFKMRSFAKDFNLPLLMKDSLLAPKLMQRSKFHLVGEKVRDRALVGRIFEKCLSAEQDKTS